MKNNSNEKLGGAVDSARADQKEVISPGANPENIADLPPLDPPPIVPLAPPAPARPGGKGPAQNDHRRIGRALGLFCFDEAVGKGLPIWLPRGAVIRQELEKLLKEMEFKAGFELVSSPHLAKESLYESSGHIPYFAESMYPAMSVGANESYRLRPMNCPHHHRVFLACAPGSGDLPLRLAEFGQVYRLEESGALAGLARVRGLCINDAHIYCRPDQVRDELDRVLRMHREVYALLRLGEIRFRLSKHQPASELPGRSADEKFVADPAAWAWSEAILRDVLREAGLDYFEAPGEAAFYGPKVDVLAKSAAGREETISTIQLDFVSSERMDLGYIGENGQRERPVIIHRAPLGSLERIVAFLLEQALGRLPTWLSPVQVRVIAIGEAPAREARAWVVRLRDQLVRAEVDARPDSLSRRLRDAFEDRVAHVIVIGAREFGNEDVMLRERSGAIRLMKAAEFEAELLEKIARRTHDV